MQHNQIFKSFLRLLLIYLLPMQILPSCSNDEEPPQPIPEPDQESVRLDDMLGGWPVFYIDISSDDCRFELNVDFPIAFDSGQAHPRVDMDVIEEDGKQYLVPRVLAPIQRPYEVYTGRVFNIEDPWQCRNIIIVIHDIREDAARMNRLRAATRASNEPNPMLSAYSEYLGRSTKCYLEPGNSVENVLLYDRFFDADGNYDRKTITLSSTNATSEMFEYEGKSFSEMMKNWSLNIGLSGNKSAGKKPINVSGSFKLGVSEKTVETESYEFYLNLYSIKKAEAKINMNRFEYEEGGNIPSKDLFALLNEDFVAAIFNYDTRYFKPEKFWENWGTDVITQGSFGGYNMYLYGRKENTYEHSVAVDAMASLKIDNTQKEIKDWVDVWKAKNSNIGKYDLGFSYNTSEYHKSSKAISVTMTKGGGNSYKDPDEWVKGFDSHENWALIGYNISSDEKGGQVDRLYPIEDMALDMLYAYYMTFKDNLSEYDLKVFENAKANIDKLIAAKEAFLQLKTVKEPKTQRLVLADFMMVKGSDIKKKGQPEPFVRKDPTENYSDRYLTYYPMMANTNAPCDHNYAFSASRGDYASAVHHDDQIFYYALAPENECQGIVDIVFEDSRSSCPDNSYARRGDNSRIWHGMLNKENYVYVKYYDENYNDPKDKITAVALVKKTNRPTSGDIYASSGGAERKPNFNATQLGKWENFWDKDEDSGPKLKYSKSVWFEGGGLIKPKDLWPAFSTKTLPIERMNDKSVVHPQKW